jgi:hydrogenase expression/formation protein HypC
MCLAIPGKIECISGDEGLHLRGKVNFGGIIKDVCLAYVPDAVTGNYVIVHAGFAISILMEEEAARIFDYLDEMAEANEAETRK